MGGLSEPAGLLEAARECTPDCVPESSRAPIIDGRNRLVLLETSDGSKRRPMACVPESHPEIHRASSPLASSSVVKESSFIPYRRSKVRIRRLTSSLIRPDSGASVERAALNRPRQNPQDQRVEQAMPCEDCGYDLRGSMTGSRCPECGAKIRSRSPAAIEGMRIDAIHESGLPQVATSQIGSFVPLAGFLLIPMIGPILTILTAFGPWYRLLALQLRYRNSRLRQFEPSGFGGTMLILAWLESLAALAVVATLLGVIPSSGWAVTTLVYSLTASISVATTCFLIARATTEWGSTIAPKFFYIGSAAALLAGGTAICGRVILLLVTNPESSAIGFTGALILGGVLAAIAILIVRDGIARLDSVLANDLLDTSRTETSDGVVPASLPSTVDPEPLPLEPERPPIRRTD